jgi:large subunit ribosomal protein L23
MKTARDIIQKPIITEKSMENSTLNKYTFKVASGANKVEIRNAIQEIFKVTVEKVNTVTMRGKVRRRGQYVGKTSDWKKAIVTVKQGQKLELGGVALFEN